MEGFKYRLYIFTLLIFLYLNAMEASNPGIEYTRQTDFSGHLTEDLVWSEDTVRVTGDIIIENPYTLTISPGVVVLFDGHYKINVLGCMVAAGTEEKPVVFTARDSAIGWQGIRFENTLSADSSTFDYCLFQFGNASILSGYNGYGGAMLIRNYNRVRISNSVFKNNTASEDGGAVACMEQSDIRFIANRFFNNKTQASGGALYISNSGPVLHRNIFAQNLSQHGGGAIAMESQSSPVLENNTIVDNESSNYGGGLYLYNQSNPVMVNTILWNNASVLEGNQIYIHDDLSDPEIRYCLIEGNLAELGLGSSAIYEGVFADNLDTYPGLESFPSYKLKANSVCIDGGDPTSTPYAGGGLRRDIGALEYTGDLVVKEIAGTGTYSFGPAGIELEILSENVDSIRVIRYYSAHSLAPAGMYEGFFQIESDNGTYAALFRMHFTREDTLDFAEGRKLSLFRLSGLDWFEEGGYEENYALTLDSLNADGIWTYGPAIPPGKPNGLLVENRLPTESIYIEWNPLVEIDLNTYLVYRSAGKTVDSANLLGPVESAKTYFEDHSYKNGVVNYYWLRAMDKAGNLSEYSDPVSTIPYFGLKRDSIALLTVFEAANGPEWLTKVNWHNAPVNQWDGIKVTQSRVTGLELNGFGLYGPLSEHIARLDSLTDLRLADNALSGSVPSELGLLKNLEHLDLSGNRFSGEVPETFPALHNLVALLLKNNAFTGLPDLSDLGTLQHLDVSGNRLDFSDLEMNVSVSDFKYDAQDKFAKKSELLLNFGESVTLAVSAGGSRTTYQWYQDTSRITDAMDSVLSIVSATASTAGSYTCYALNDLVSGLMLESEPVLLHVDMPPQVPSGLSGQAGNAFVQLRWDINSETDMYGYHISRKEMESPDSAARVAAVPATNDAFMDTSVENGLWYTYYLSALDSNGNESALSGGVSFRPDGPPEWNLPAFVSFSEDENLTVDLNDWVTDSDPDSSLKLEITENDLFDLALGADGHLSIAAPGDYFGTGNIGLRAIDPRNQVSESVLQVRLLPVNDIPEITGKPDTTINTFVTFIYKLKARDVDGDSLTFQTDTDLFSMNEAGWITFTPVLSDTGMHNVHFQVSDGDTSIHFSGRIHIVPNMINPPVNLQVESGDQVLELKWENPENYFISGTKIKVIDREGNVVQNPYARIIDTTFATPGTVGMSIEELPIGREFRVEVCNYFQVDTVTIPSAVVNALCATASPRIGVHKRTFHEQVGVNDTTVIPVHIRNEGAGTLIGYFESPADTVQERWYSVVNGFKSVAPFDSIVIPVLLHPGSNVEREIAGISLSFMSNDAASPVIPVTISMEPLFDDYSPELVVMNTPDSLVNQSAVCFRYIADDTSGVPVGDMPDELWSHYICRNTLTGDTVLNGYGTGMEDIILYPLKDGFYRFELWLTDREKNGYHPSIPLYSRNFLVRGETRILPQNRWILTGIPMVSSHNPAAFSETGAACSSYRWNYEQNAYVALKDTTIHAGSGFWIYADKNARVDISGTDFPATGDTVRVRIDKGWNQITNPFPCEIAWKDVTFRSNKDALALKLEHAFHDDRNMILPALYWTRPAGRFDGYEWGMIDTLHAKPWFGYWMYANEAGMLVFTNKPTFRQGTETANPLVNRLSKVTHEKWELNLSLRRDDYADSRNIAGFTTKNDYSIAEPPSIGDYSTLYLGTLDHRCAAEYKTKPAGDDAVTSWNIYVSTRRPGEAHQLRWDLPEETHFFVYLVDNRTEKIMDLRGIREYLFTPETEERQFTLYITADAGFKPAIIPETCRLLQNYPNPFNPQTSIRFGLPADAAGRRTVLRVYDILGKEVTTLIDDFLEPGYHEVRWNGENHMGQKVASGFYFYRLDTGVHADVRKMLIVR